MGFSIGFADELEKLALRLPSMGEMTSGFGSEPAPAPSAVSEPTPATQNVHVHVHPQGGGKGSSPRKAALPKPAKDVPVAHSKEPEFLPPRSGGYQTSSEVGNQILTPKSPAFSGGTQAPTHNYSSQMKNYVDEGTGPTKQHYFNPSAVIDDNRKFDSAPVTNITGHDLLNATAGQERNPMAGLVQQKKSRPAPGGAPVPTPWASAGGVKPVIQQMTPAEKPKKKMFGTALALNDEPAKM